MQGYAADTMNEFLDMLGMEKLDEKEKGEVKLGERFQVKDSGDKKGKENEKAKGERPLGVSKILKYAF